MTTTIDELKVPVTPKLPLDEIAEYEKLSRELRIENPEAKLEALRAFLAENGITVYPLKAVDSYLREKAKKEGGPQCYWCWKPLRQSDARIPSHQWAMDQAMQAMNRVLWSPPVFIPLREETMRPSFSERLGLKRPNIDMRTLQEATIAARESVLSPPEPILPHGVMAADLYRHSIPHAVLLTMKKIADRFPDAQFFATDYAVQHPDPFLAVGIPNTEELFIIERWDEPGFRM